jgi:hypothetical protein
MYEPTQREVTLEMAKTPNKIEEKLNYLLGTLIAILLFLIWRV